MTNGWLNMIFWGIAGLLFAMSGRMLWHLRWARRLPPSAPGNDEGSAPPPPRVSVVLAARDEAARVEQTVRRLLAQRGVEVEVIVVDDRSTDGTGEILRRLSQEDERVKALRVETLPPEWLGKCHACHVGASAACGEWILFTDADCWLKEDVLLRALRVAARERAEHITLTPGIRPENRGAAAWHLAFLLTLADWLSGVNRDKAKAYLGMGAFNLVRASAYQACGGYGALRLTVVDDVKLGLLLRRAGFRTRGFIGGDDTECHWGTTIGGMIRVMEKNYFAAVDYRIGAALGSSLMGTALWATALCGPFTASAPGLAAGVGVLSLSIPAAVAARRLRWPLSPAFLAPFIFPALFYAILNSTVVTLRHGGIRWRDTFYPLELLHRGTVR